MQSLLYYHYSAHKTIIVAQQTTERDIEPTVCSIRKWETFSLCSIFVS